MLQSLRSWSDRHPVPLILAPIAGLLVFAVQGGDPVALVVKLGVMTVVVALPAALVLWLLALVFRH